MTGTFESARLRMRPMRVEDAEAFHASWADPEFMRYLSSAAHADLDESRRYLAERIADPGSWRGWTMVLKDGGRPVGTLATGTRRQGVVEIGYMVVREQWGTGVAREGVSWLIDLLFAEGNRRVFADTDPDNAASNRLLERLGFTCEARLRAEWETHIGVRDALIWGLLRDEWPANRST